MTSSRTAPARVATAETDMILLSDADGPVVHAELRYVTQQPFAVQLSLCLGDLPAVDWVFARELLIDGIRMPAGQGDIQIYPTSNGVVIELHSPDGEARMLADSAELTSFTFQVEALVPLGTESGHYCLDDVLTELLALSDPWAGTA